MTTFKDLDLREALRRKYTNTLTLPADFKEKKMKILRDIFDKSSYN